MTVSNNLWIRVLSAWVSFNPRCNLFFTGSSCLVDNLIHVHAFDSSTLILDIFWVTHILVNKSYSEQCIMKNVLTSKCVTTFHSQACSSNWCYSNIVSCKCLQTLYLNTGRAFVQCKFIKCCVGYCDWRYLNRFIGDFITSYMAIWSFPFDMKGCWSSSIPLWL